MPTATPTSLRTFPFTGKTHDPPPPILITSISVPPVQPPLPVQDCHQDLDRPQSVMQHLLQRSPDRAFRDKTGIRLPKQPIKPPSSPFSPLTYKAWNEELVAPSSPEAYRLLHKFKHLKTEPPLGAEGWQPEDFLRYMLHCTRYIRRSHLPLCLLTEHPDPPFSFFLFCPSTTP